MCATLHPHRELSTAYNAANRKMVGCSGVASTGSEQTMCAGGDIPDGSLCPGTENTVLCGS